MTSLKGLPEFYGMRVAQSRRDWAARTGEMKWFRVRGTALAPGATEIVPFYTVPTGKALYWCGTFFSSDIQGYAIFKLPPLGLESDGWMKAFGSYANTLDPAIKIPAGTTINIEVTNLDVITGGWACELYTYEVDI